MDKNIEIVYYSGTGGTERVAKCFEKTFNKNGYTARSQRLFKNREIVCSNESPLMLIYAVHAFNAPEVVYKWIDSLGQVNNISAIVLSVSGGGEMTPNTACRVSSIKKLERKGYKVTYENMLVMPSNWMITPKEALAKRILEVMPNKVEHIINEISIGTIRRTKPSLLDRFFSYIGEYEKLGTSGFGSRIEVSDTCNGCGICVENCPSDNITLISNKPEFGDKCDLCLSCIYGCPNNSLEPGIAKLMVVKEGYSLSRLENLQTTEEKADIEELAKGYLYSGIRKYLHNEN